MDNMQKIQSLQIDKQVSNSQGNPRATPETLGAQGVSPTYVNVCVFSLRPLLLKMLIGPKTRKFYGLQRPVSQPGDIDAKLLSKNFMYKREGARKGVWFWFVCA